MATTNERNEFISPDYAARQKFSDTSILDYLQNEPLESRPDDQAVFRKDAPNDAFMTDYLKETAAELAANLMASTYVVGMCWFLYQFWAFVYEIIAFDWLYKIAGSPLTVGALFCVACVYFWMQICIYKLGGMFRTGKWASELLISAISSSLAVTQLEIEKRFKSLQ